MARAPTPKIEDLPVVVVPPTDDHVARAAATHTEVAPDVVLPGGVLPGEALADGASVRAAVIPELDRATATDATGIPLADGASVRAAVIPELDRATATDATGIPLADGATTTHVPPVQAMPTSDRLIDAFERIAATPTIAEAAAAAAAEPVKIARGSLRVRAMQPERRRAGFLFTPEFRVIEPQFVDIDKVIEMAGDDALIVEMTLDGETFRSVTLDDLERSGASVRDALAASTVSR